MYQDLDEGGRLLTRLPMPGSHRYVRVEINCRQCIGCLKARADELGVRGYHESCMHDRNCMVTLTYAKPWRQSARFPGGQVNRRDIDLFLKRLREQISPLKISVLGCAEYGEQETRRAHAHINIYGYDFPDRMDVGKTKGGARMYRSHELDVLWGHGMAICEDVSIATAVYAASYAAKAAKYPGEPVGMRSDGYIPKAHRKWRFDPQLGKRFFFEPPFLVISRRPGLGYSFLEKYFDDIFNAGCVVLPDGRKTAIPETYLRWIRAWSEDDFQELKDKRKAIMVEQLSERMARRLQDRETVVRAGLARTMRDAI